MDSQFDDTVTLPPRPRERIVELTPDLDQTITVQRAERHADAAAEAPGATVAASAEAPEPFELVPPPPAAPAAVSLELATITVARLVDDDNTWSEPIPLPPRPFRVRLDDGTLVPLDEPVYLGRRPSVPRIHPGGIPLLVTLDSPRHEVSSTHLQLTTIGGAIVATDMRSTNGSVVRVPGVPPHTLLGGESTVVTPGTVIELGDGNLIELLGPDHDREDGS